MPPIIVYVTGFHQHAGKTVTCLGLISLLKKIISPSRIGYFKPVGQELVTLSNGEKVDKDAKLVNTFSGIPDLDLSTISPVRLGSGFTRKYLDSKDRHYETSLLRERINKSLEKMAEKDIIIAEGTGHPGVGNIVGLSNAKVSNLMKAEIVYLSGGGIGKALDALEVDLSYFLYKKSRVRGIIFNKLIPDKIPTVKKYITEDLINTKFVAAGGPIQILGYLPEIEHLMLPSMKYISKKWKKAEILGKGKTEFWTAPCNRIKVLSMPSEDLRRKKFLNPGNLLILSAMHQKRIRSILKYNKRLIEKSKGLGGLIITGGDFVSLDPKVKEEVYKAELPAIFVPEHTAVCEEKLLRIYENTKIQVYDRSKIKEIDKLFEQYFDAEKFLNCFNINIK